MRIELRNIGPINRAAIDLDEFAILVGPNASGKTTLSVAAYAALLAHRQTERTVVRMLDHQAMLKRRQAASPGLDFDEVAETFAVTLRENLAAELERCFAPDLSKLPRRGRTGNGSAPRILLSHRPAGEAEWTLVFRIREGSLTLEPRHPEYRSPRFDRMRVALSHERSWSELRRSNMARQRRLVDPVYFPAARSGYVQMRSVLYSLLIGALGRGYFNQISLGKMSGIAADFLEFLADIDPTAESRLPQEVTERLERELLRGHLRLTATAEAASVVEFAPEGLNEYWPMDSAATSIGELAPLLLYLRHKARPRNMLFIDEPEAHLHPRNQLVLADILLDVSRLIAGTVVGTHSEFFVTGINNGLLRRAADGSERLPLSLYELVPAPTTGGYVTSRCPVDPKSGFTVEQFSDAAEDALDEAQDLFERQQRMEI